MYLQLAQRAGRQESCPKKSLYMQEYSTGLLSRLFGENKKKSKAALKAEGNPADEEQPLTGLSQQVYSSNTGH